MQPVQQVPVLAYFISDHGLGHGARSCSVITELIERGATVHIVSKVPRAFFEESIRKNTKGSWVLHEVKTDIGAFQATSIEIDWTKTVEELEKHWADIDVKAANVAEMLRPLGIKKVVFDITALGAKVAHLLRVPSIALSNFTFDWIYEAERSRVPALGKFIEMMKSSYRTTSLYLALPFVATDLHSFDGIPRFNLALVSRRPSLSRQDVLRILGWSDLQNCRLMLYSFGGHHFPIEQCFAKWSVPNDWRIIWVEPTEKVLPMYERILVIPHSRLRELGLPYIDLLAAVDVVLCKTGYGVVSELIATGRVSLYTDRPGWAEHDWLIRGLHANVPSMRVSNDEALQLEASLWPRINALSAQPVKPTIAFNGSEQAAEIILSTDPVAKALEMATAESNTHNNTTVTPVSPAASTPLTTAITTTTPSAASPSPSAAPAPASANKKKKQKPAAAATATTHSPVPSPAPAAASSTAPPDATPAASAEPATPEPAEAEPAAAELLDAKALFEKELAWCINQLHLGLKHIKDPAQIKESKAVLAKLSSPKHTMPFKRHLMHVVFGDYRKRIQEEERQKERERAAGKR